MRKDLSLNIIYLISLFALSIVLKSWFSLDKVFPLAVGGLIGVVFPYVDYLIYAYIIKPGNTADLSQIKLNRTNILATIRQYYTDKTISTELVMHSALFQVALVVFTFFVVSSSASLLARGIVLGMCLHLSLDQVNQYMQSKEIDSWFAKFPMELEANQKRTFMILAVVALVVCTLFF